ncbi:MAG: insulinase family protein [Sphingomonadales bacterium]|nr:insulinase family protein [Sphingomonadales bacterium]MDE2168286.1 insulinase family protein [Sphingomonadales bacterium]
MRTAKALLLVSTLLLVPAASIAQTHAPAATMAKPAPLSQLVKAVDIPYETFKLKNGLTVIIHTDRKTPIIGVTTYYRVGSKNEPKGHTGFAHLYEHLFFGGSENVPNFDEPLEAAGSDSTNGSTWYDRTNYVETVPTGALPLALFEESDRMGHLLGAVTQDKLDKQRGVVENEKRQGDNQPYGLTQYTVADLFPIGHPYHHTTIGSMGDLDAATLTDVRRWFTDHYAPGNAILVLAGDIDVATARPLVEKYFGDIPAGPLVKPVVAGPVTLPAPIRREMTDQVATTRLSRFWSGPGTNDVDAPALEVGMSVLGGLASSRLDNALVRGRQLAVSVSADVEQHEQISILTVSMDVKPGVDRKVAEAALDEEVAKFLKEGPSADEVRRAATREVSNEIGALEVVGGFGGKGATLAEGLLYSGNPAEYRKDLEEIAGETPAKVKAAMDKWLGRPALMLAVTPGKRTESGDQLGGWGDEASSPHPKPDLKLPVPPVAQSAPRTAPPVAPVDHLTFPALERARLSNGIEVVLARRTAVPKVLVTVDFNAGIAGDALDTPGTQGMLMAMLDEGTDRYSATALREEQERLGASISASAGMDDSTVSLSALTANLAPSLDLLADVVRHPAFAPAEVARIKQERLAQLSQTLASPQGLAFHVFNPILFGPNHPYGHAGDGLGDKASISAFTPDMLRAAQAKWLRPDLARIVVVGDVTMAQLQPQLEASFGHWAAPASPKPAKPITAAIPAPNPRIVLIDRPGSPQSMIVAGRVLPVTGTQPGQEAINLANEVLGGDFLSRLNMDLREEKSWTYGVQSLVRQPVGQRSLIVLAPVQTDRTGDSITALLADMKELATTKPVTPAELQRTTDGNIRALPGKVQTNGQVMGEVLSNLRLGRPDDYEASLPALYRKIDAAALDNAIRAQFKPQDLVFVVVGDRKLVEPQLAKVGLPVEVMTVTP